MFWFQRTEDIVSELIQKGTIFLSKETLRGELHFLNWEKSIWTASPLLKSEQKDWRLASCLDHVDLDWDYVIITKTCLYNFDPLKPHFYIVKLGFTGYTLVFLFLLKNIDCGYSLEPPRRGGSNEYPQSMFGAEIWKKYLNFLSQNFRFLIVKFSVYLNRHIFVIYIQTAWRCIPNVLKGLFTRDQSIVLNFMCGRENLGPPSSVYWRETWQVNAVRRYLRDTCFLQHRFYMKTGFYSETMTLNILKQGIFWKVDWTQRYYHFGLAKL